MRQENGRSFVVKGFDAVLRNVPKRIGYPLTIGLGIAGGVACGSSGNNPESSTVPGTNNTSSAASGTPLETSFTSPTLTDSPMPSLTLNLPSLDKLAVEPSDEDGQVLTIDALSVLNLPRFIKLPFPPDVHMKIVQAWTSDYNSIHHAIDIAKVGNSGIWDTFPLLAGADGEACTNPPNREGNAVMILHIINDMTVGEYDGHLANIEPGIPNCGTGTKTVKQGDKVGDAGATGVFDKDGNPQPTWVHTHWRIFILNPDGTTSSIDPFDLRDYAEYYPNINVKVYSNGKYCGETPLLIDCPTENSDKPNPIVTPDHSTDNWPTFPSSYGYEIKYPDNWSTSHGQFANGDNAVVEYFNGPVIENAQVDIGIVGHATGENFDLNDYINKIGGVIIGQGQTYDWDEVGIEEVSKIKIAGQETTFVYYTIDNPSGEISYKKIAAVFVENGEVLQVTLSLGRDFSFENEQSVLNIYSSVLKSIHS